MKWQVKEGQEGAPKPLEVSPLLLRLPQDRDTRNRLRKTGGCGGKVHVCGGGGGVGGEGVEQEERKPRRPIWAAEPTPLPEAV